MFKRLIEELWVDDRAFRFNLCRKPETMGPVPVDHWWMDVRRLYGQRGRQSLNREPIIDFHWALCRREGTSGERDVQESFILVHLLPHCRSNAARDIFTDANSTSPTMSKLERASMGDDLENSLRSSRSQGLTWAEFEQKTQDILGPPRLDEDTRVLYHEFVAETLGQARDSLVRNGVEEGLAVARRVWGEAMRKWSRRVGFDREKRVLDVLSYEARAAFHQCYDTTWEALIDHLAKTYGLSTSSRRFLKLWHMDWRREREEQPELAFDHLFHGHIFGLHPVGGGLVRAPTGREIIGDWLLSDGSNETFERLLHAIYIAVYHYADRRETAAEDRKK